MGKKNRRKDADAVVYRKTAKDLRTKTVYDTKEVVNILCVTCLNLKPLSSFYLESEKKRKYIDQHRKQCATCWDKYKGANAVMFESRSKITATLDTFIED